MTFVGLVAALVASCTSVPEPIRSPVDGPDIAAVRKAPGAFLGRTVRWGGRVLALTNDTEHSTIEVLARNGRPIDSDYTPGRFLAQVQGFLEPTQFEHGRLVTVVGTIGEPLTGNIGDHSYLYPVVLVRAVHPWEEYVRPAYYYDPFYDPYYWPYWGYPYYYGPFYPRFHAYPPPIKRHRLPPRRLH